MKGKTVALAFLGAFTCASAMLAAPGQTTARPGEMTQARVFIENRGNDEAIPVSLENLGNVTRPLSVEVSGTPAVTLTPTTVVRTALARQPWEYRVLTVAGGAAEDAALRQAGSDGWEAVGLQPATSGFVVLLKRPR
jgi:hypothetical protein